MLSEIQETIEKIKSNMMATDKSLLLIMFENFDKRIARLEKQFSPSFYNILNLIVQYLQAIALFVLAYCIYRLSRGE
jgi:hypothetical protein